MAIEATMARMNGKSALVTGAASGMGRAIAERLLSEGAKVALLDVNGVAVREVAQSLGTGDNVLPIEADTANIEDIERAVGSAVAEFDKIDILVNNAGVFDYNAPCEELDPSVWDRLMAINVRGYAFAMKTVLKYMLPTGRGAIVNNCSVNALVAGGGGAAYASSKGAILALNRQVAFEVGGRGVRVNAVAPGAIETDLVANSSSIINPNGFSFSPQQRRFYDEMTSSSLAKVPLGRSATSAEVASVVAFLASEDASYVTGECVVVDGGYVIS